MERIEKKTSADYLISTWSGGQTIEILVEPDSSHLAQRDFEFRLSTATVTTDRSEFSDFTGYQRILLSLDRSISLVQSGCWIDLKAFEPYSFDGKLPTICYGKCQDFNVIYKDGYDVSVQILKERQVILPQTTAVIYALADSSLLLSGDNTQRQGLLKNETLILKNQTALQVELLSSRKQPLTNSAILTTIKKQSRR
ncbi:HutD family protein [Enterococcus sp.]|uniref:HutD/Ves family protein n=1 Tax=Enterococcus sp. TaxID=35783 RepID=UPI0025B937E5|nr:HutD family protein [Enterococcus sp.]